jgi:uncharacterized protein YkwD
MSKASLHLNKRDLLTVLIIVLSASGLGTVSGLQSGPPSTSDSLGEAPTNSSTVGTATTSVATTNASVVTITPYDPGFIDTSNKEQAFAAWKTINDRPRTKMKWTGSTGSCDPGTTTEGFKEDVLARVRWFRGMAGVDTNISLNLESSRLAQEAALVMKANNDLSHEPTSSWGCFTDDAYEGASHSNLSLGDYGVASIDGYIEDWGSDNLPVGHRRWILDPTLAEIGTGDTNYSNALFVISDNTRDNFTTREPDGFVMWPPRGYVPRATIFPRWSISHPKADFSQAKVKIEFQGRTKTFNDPYSDSDGYGNLNTLVFEWIRPSKGTGGVIITVSGIELDGTMRTVTYEVRPFG